MKNFFLAILFLLSSCAHQLTSDEVRIIASAGIAPPRYLCNVSKINEITFEKVDCGQFSVVSDATGAEEMSPYCPIMITSQGQIITASKNMMRIILTETDGIGSGNEIKRTQVILPIIPEIKELELHLYPGFQKEVPWVYKLICALEIP